MSTRLLSTSLVLLVVTGACTRGQAPGVTETTAAITVTTLAGAVTTPAAGPTTTTGAPTAAGATLQAVRDRGSLVCGVNEAVPGFGFLNPEGEFEGFDIDYCKAVAAAVLGDPEAVEYLSLTADQRFPALQSGEVDVLIRNTTWTVTRDADLGTTFAHTTFYDGQGMMVRADSGIGAIEDMGGTTICVLTGTTTELNLNTRMAAGNIDFTPLPFEDNETLQEAFIADRCDGWTSDKSQLAGVRSAFPEEEGGPDALIILDETFSKEPLGPVTRDGDSQWSQIVDWVVTVTILAEELGVDSGNVEQMAEDPPNDDVSRLLGQPVGDPPTAFESGLALEADWVQDVIAAVGNYGEIYDRNVGPDTGLGLERGLNALWTEGGLLYSPPYR